MHEVFNNNHCRRIALGLCKYKTDIGRVMGNSIIHVINSLEQKISVNRNIFDPY